MSKKMNKLVLLSALMIVIIGTIGTVSAVEPHNLVAGGDQVVGSVTVTNDSTNIYVTFTTTDGWSMTETHLHIANESVDGIPQTKKNNPIPGQFDYSEEHVPSVTEYIYEIPLTELSGEVFIAAHAVVQKPSVNETTGEFEYDGEGNLIYLEESAWGNDLDFLGSNWAMYSNYTLPLSNTA